MHPSDTLPSPQRRMLHSPGSPSCNACVVDDRFRASDPAHRATGIATIQHSDGAGASLRNATDAVARNETRLDECDRDQREHATGW